MAFKIDQQSSLEFEYIELLDRGRLSEIHLAQCVDNTDLKVAIKRHRSDRENVNEWMDQVEKEISVLHHLNTTESPDWSFDMSLRNRLNYTASTVAERSIIQLISVFEIDGLTAIALEIAPPSITSQTLDKYTLITVMHQLALMAHMAHEGGVALTDFDPLVKIPRIRWDNNLEQIKIIDWNVTRETEDYKRRDIIYLGRIYFQLLTGFPAWSKGAPPIDGLPDRLNEYALEITGAGINTWVQIETAIRDLIERLMIQDTNDSITSSEMLLSATANLKELADLAQRIENGSATALNEMEQKLQEASTARPPQLRQIADIGSFFLKVAPDNRKRDYINQIEGAERLLKTAYLDRITQASEYFEQQKYAEALAELENARSRFTTNHMLSNAANYRYAVAGIGELIQNKGTLGDDDLKTLMAQLLEVVEGLESRLWDTTRADEIRDDIRAQYPAEVVNLPAIQKLFADIDASKAYSAQIYTINRSARQSHIDRGWEIREAQRIETFTKQIIPELQRINQQSFIDNRIQPMIENVQKNILEDERDLKMVQRFLRELGEGSTSIDIEGYVEKSTLERPYAPLTISTALLPKDQSDLSADGSAGDAIERYQTFRNDWDNIIASKVGVEDKLKQFSTLVSENEDMIEVFREKLPTVTIPGKSSERKTVYRDLEDLTQFINSVNFVYDELGSIGLNRIPNINKIQQNWVYVTNVQDPDLKNFVGSIQTNLATHTNKKVQDKSLPPELSMLVYEIIDVPVPTEVMQIGQEIQLHKYVRDTLRQSQERLKDPDAIEGVIGELNRLTARNLGELDDVIQQLLQKLEQLRDALQARTIVRQIRTLYRVVKRKIETDNKDIKAFGEEIDKAVDELINEKIREIEKALDKAKANKPMSRDEEMLVHDTQRILDTLRHNNLLHERRWHHVQNSQAYLVREYTRTLEQATTSFNNYQFKAAREHIDRAFYLGQLFEMPSDSRLSDELRTAEEMVAQLSEHYSMTRSVETIQADDIKALLDSELEFWKNLLIIVKDLAAQSKTQQATNVEESNEEIVTVSFEPQQIEHLIEGLNKAKAVTDAMQRVHRAVDRLRELQQIVDIYELTLLQPLVKRLDDVLEYNYTQTLNKQITEIEQIASRERIISNESIINRLRQGYALIEMNKELQILNESESTRRQRQLQTNAYTALKNITLKNQDERQALAEFIETLPPQEVRSREFQGVLARLAEDANSYAYIMEQVHNIQLPNLGGTNNRQIRRILLIVAVVAVIAVVLGLLLSGALPLEGFTL